MLKEEQAALLLARCESIVGFSLKQIRGNLKKSGGRAAALWELLLLEAASLIGTVEYEPLQTGSPDIRLRFKDETFAWLEAAFVYPRFWKEEQRSDEINKWIHEEGKRRGIPASKLVVQYFGDLKSDAGPRRWLPSDNEKKSFLRDRDFRAFFDAIKLNPLSNHVYQSAQYSFLISYSYQNPDRGFVASTGLVQEVPKKVDEHAVYRALRTKAKQHNKIEGPCVICICSDQSRVVSNSHTSFGPTMRDAIRAAFEEYSTLSAVLIVDIKDRGGFHQVKREARADIYPNESARHKLSDHQVSELARLNFNRWKYGFALLPSDKKLYDHLRRVSGPSTLTFHPERSPVEITLPANLIIDALAGKTSYKTAFGSRNDDPVARFLREGWVVEGCSFTEGDVMQAKAPSITLKLSPPPEKVYGEPKS